MFRLDVNLPWWQEHTVRCQNAQPSPPGSVRHLRPRPASRPQIKPTKGWLSWDPAERQLSDIDNDKAGVYFLQPLCATDRLT